MTSKSVSSAQNHHSIIHEGFGERETPETFIWERQTFSGLDISRVPGPSLPRALSGTSLETMNDSSGSLIVVGGHDGGNCRTEMYQLSCSTPTTNCSDWRKLEAELRVPRCHFVTMKVPSTFEICPPED